MAVYALMIVNHVQKAMALVIPPSPYIATARLPTFALTCLAARLRRASR